MTKDRGPGPEDKPVAKQGSLFGGEKGDGLPRPPKIIRLADRIASEPLESPEYLHSILCQVGLPRKAVQGPRYEQRNGKASMLIEAGELWRDGEWIRQPIPYGTRPRLILVHVSSVAVKTKSPEVDLGGSVREFLRKLEIDTSGREHALINKQILALSACHMTLGLGTTTVDAKPIDRFDCWADSDTSQGVIRLSTPFFESLTDSAVPLDPRALNGLKHSALALDVYTWLAHRLRRIKQDSGDRVTWAGLNRQFGAYGKTKNFKKKFLIALGQVRLVYPDAKIEDFEDGLILKQSKAPIPKTAIGYTKKPTS